MSSGDDQRIAWMRQLIEWSQELQEPGEFPFDAESGPRAGGSFMRLRQRDAYWNCRAGATPRWILPIPCTPKLAHQLRGCKSERADGFAAPRKSSSGDVVEILTQKRAQAQSRLAQLRPIFPRQKQNSALQSIPRSAKEATENGESACWKTKSRNFPRGLEENPQRGFAKNCLRNTALSRVEDLFAAVGFGKILPRVRCCPAISGNPLASRINRWKTPSPHW